MMNQIFDVLANIGAAAYCSPLGLNEIGKVHPNYVEECNLFSAAITFDLMNALVESLVDAITVRDYLKMLYELREYRAMYLYLVLCFVGIEKEVPQQFLEYGQNAEMLALLMREMLEDVEE